MGGFGGLYTFLHLRKHVSARRADITIINKTNHFLFTPLLHEVATGDWHIIRLSSLFDKLHTKKGANVLVAEVKNINTAHKIVETETSSVPYDYLVIATGAVTDFYSIPAHLKNTHT